MTAIDVETDAGWPGDGPRFCVIGAGAAGMAAMKALAHAGVAFDCFEATDRVGGHWHTDYDCLHLITPHAGSGYRGDPMPSDWSDFPRRSEMVDYLEGYATKYDLRDRVRFGTRVERLEPMGERAIDGWNVSTSDGATRRYTGVIVANGHNSVPFIPMVSGKFDGRVMHSSEYKNPADIAGSRVLVVGSGNSGCDIASELAQAGCDVVFSVRAGHLFQPKTFFGKPRGTLKVMKLPPRLLDPVLRFMIRMSVGRPETYGLPAPTHKSLNDQRPVVNSLVLHWIQHGRVHPVPGLRSFDGTTVETVDGVRHEVDTIVWATGFRAVLPFLQDELIQRADGIPLRVGGCILPAGGPANLYFVGLCAPRGPQLPVYSDQMEVILEMIDVQERIDAPLVDAYSKQAPEHRIDIVRSVWNDDMKATRRTLSALSTRAARRTSRRRTTATSAPAAVGSWSRAAIITGAAAGLGRACASKLAADGLRLLLVDTDSAAVADFAGQLSAGGAEVATCVADIRTQQACQSAVAAGVSEFGGVDVLVNAAGVYPRKPVLDISADDWQFVFEVNVLGTYFMMTAAIADMRTRGTGHIVNISSIDGFKAHPSNAHYAATKAAVISLTRSIALEVAPLGILVNSVAPGPMATAAAKLTDWYEPMVAALPTRQPIEPDEVARLVAYLSHTDNISIAGENIVVSGAGVIV